MISAKASKPFTPSGRRSLAGAKETKLPRLPFRRLRARNDVASALSNDDPEGGDEIAKFLFAACLIGVIDRPQRSRPPHNNPVLGADKSSILIFCRYIFARVVGHESGRHETDDGAGGDVDRDRKTGLIGGK